MSIFGALLAFRKPQRQSLIGLIPVLQEAIPVPLTTCIDITASPYNCVHDSSTNPDVAILNANRIGLQAAIDAAHTAGGAKLCAPAGYDIPFNRNTVSGSYGVQITSTYPIAFEMEGVTLRMNRASGANDFYGIQVLSTGGVKFKGVTFSQRGLNAGSEQQHMVQVGNGSTTGARYVDFINCKFHEGVGGDGIRLLGFGTTDTPLVQDIRIMDCTFINCDRSGVSSQRGCRRVLITGCRFSGTVDQDIDFEPTGSGILGQYTITHNTIVRTGNGSGAVTLTGQGSSDANERSIFANNIITGGRVSARKVSNLIVEGNQINAGATANADAVLDFGSYGPGISIANNIVVRPSTAVAGNVLTLEYDSDRPSDLAVTGNQFTQQTEGHAVFVDSIERISLIGNHVTCTYSSNTYSAIRVDNGGSTAYDHENIIQIIGNTVECTASSAAFGIRVVGDTTDKATAIVLGNDVRNCVVGIAAASRTGGSVPGSFESPIMISGNSIRGCSTAISAGSYYAQGGNGGDILDLVGSGDPEGTAYAPVGSTYRRTSNGTVYRKTSGSVAVNTGWVTP